MQKTATKQQQQQLKLDVRKTTPIVCDTEGCGSEVFIPAMKFRRVPKLLTGSKEDQILPVSIYMCVSCGSIPAQFDLDIEG
jgi:hypothetical protein